jgi:hypothetical protein
MIFRSSIFRSSFQFSFFIQYFFSIRIRQRIDERHTHTHTHTHTHLLSMHPKTPENRRSTCHLNARQERLKSGHLAGSSRLQKANRQATRSDVPPTAATPPRAAQGSAADRPPGGGRPTRATCETWCGTKNQLYKRTNRTDGKELEVQGATQEQRTTNARKRSSREKSEKLRAEKRG